MILQLLNDLAMQNPFVLVVYYLIIMPNQFDKRHHITMTICIHNAYFAKVRADTCITHGFNFHAIRYIFGIINNNPCDAVNVEETHLAVNAP